MSQEPLIIHEPGDIRGVAEIIVELFSEDLPDLDDYRAPNGVMPSRGERAPFRAHVPREDRHKFPVDTDALSEAISSGKFHVGKNTDGDEKHFQSYEFDSEAFKPDEWQRLKEFVDQWNQTMAMNRHADLVAEIWIAEEDPRGMSPSERQHVHFAALDSQSGGLLAEAKERIPEPDVLPKADWHDVRPLQNPHFRTKQIITIALPDDVHINAGSPFDLRADHSDERGNAVFAYFAAPPLLVRTQDVQPDFDNTLQGAIESGILLSIPRQNGRETVPARILHITPPR